MYSQAASYIKIHAFFLFLGNLLSFPDVLGCREFIQNVHLELGIPTLLIFRETSRISHPLLQKNTVSSHGKIVSMNLEINLREGRFSLKYFFSLKYVCDVAGAHFKVEVSVRQQWCYGSGTCSELV